MVVVFLVMWQKFQTRKIKISTKKINPTSVAIRWKKNDFSFFFWAEKIPTQKTLCHWKKKKTNFESRTWRKWGSRFLSVCVLFGALVFSFIFCVSLLSLWTFFCFVFFSSHGFFLLCDEKLVKSEKKCFFRATRFQTRFVFFSKGGRFCFPSFSCGLFFGMKRRERGPNL